MIQFTVCHFIKSVAEYQAMKCVLLAAGEGVRMRPLTLIKPKSLLEVAGKPLLYYHFSALPEEINEVIVVIGYLADQIEKYLGNEFLGRKVSYVYMPKVVGTYGVVAGARELLGQERFLVVYGDDLHNPLNFQRCLVQSGLSLLFAEIDNPDRFGEVVLNSDSTVKDVIEKPEKRLSNRVNTGPVVLDSRIFNYKPPISPKGEYYLTDAVGAMVRAGHKVSGVKADWWIPIGYPEDLKKAEDFLSTQR